MPARWKLAFLAWRSQRSLNRLWTEDILSGRQQANFQKRSTLQKMSIVVHTLTIRVGRSGEQGFLENSLPKSRYAKSPALVASRLPAEVTGKLKSYLLPAIRSVWVEVICCKRNRVFWSVVGIRILIRGSETWPDTKKGVGDQKRSESTRAADTSREDFLTTLFWGRHPVHIIIPQIYLVSGMTETDDLFCHRVIWRLLIVCQAVLTQLLCSAQEEKQQKGREMRACLGVDLHERSLHPQQAAASGCTRFPHPRNQWSVDYA